MWGAPAPPALPAPGAPLTRAVIKTVGPAGRLINIARGSVVDKLAALTRASAYRPARSGRLPHERGRLPHPGATGGTVAAACAGPRWWCSDARSAASAERAERAGLRDAGTLAELVERCDVIVSVCPPAAALGLAERVAGLGFDGVYVDANAIAPAIARVVGEPSARFCSNRALVSGFNA